MTTTILVVDDQVLLCKLLTVLLKKAGYEVATANNGAEALDYIQQAEQTPDAIILDLMMPVMDGWTFLKHRRADLQCAAIPVIVLSAMVIGGLPDTVADLYDLGVQAVLPKAADHAELLSTVQAILVGAPIP